MNRFFRYYITPLFLLLFMSLHPIQVAAQTEMQLSQSEVETLLNQIESTFLTTTSLGTTFEQEKKISFFEDTIKSTGALLFQSPGKVRMDSFAPFKTSAILNGDATVQYEFVNGLWNKVDSANNNMLQVVMKNIISWLQGKFNDISLYRVTALRINNQAILTLTPQSPEYKKYIHHFELGINKAVNGLDFIVIMLPDGDYTRYTFFNDRINVKLPSELFNTQTTAPSALPSWLGQTL